MTRELPEGIRDSAKRGDHAGEPHLADGEFICPVEEDYIGGEPEEVAAHALGAHDENYFFRLDDVKDVSRMYRGELSVQQTIEGTSNQETIYEEHKRNEEIKEMVKEKSQGPGLPGASSSDEESGGLVQTIKSYWPF